MDSLLKVPKSPAQQRRYCEMLFFRNLCSCLEFLREIEWKLDFEKPTSCKVPAKQGNSVEQ